MVGKIKPGKLAVVMVRGLAKVRQPIRDTLLMLNLARKNHCVVVESNSVYQGMITKVKDFVTWGEIDENMLEELLAKRGELFKGRVSDSKNKYNYNSFEFNGKKYKKCFRLNPPRKGFGRKGIKVSYRAGGALGYRGEKITDLLMRMI
ncbi:MAG: 50S ribosomal protein L30 [Nanoarchaeota archaeon]